MLWIAVFLVVTTGLTVVVASHPGTNADVSLVWIICTLPGMFITRFLEVLTETWQFSSLCKLVGCKSDDRRGVKGDDGPNSYLASYCARCGKEIFRVY